MEKAILSQKIFATMPALYTILKKLSDIAVFEKDA